MLQKYANLFVVMTSKIVALEEQIKSHQPAELITDDGKKTLAETYAAFGKLCVRLQLDSTAARFNRRSTKANNRCGEQGW